MGEGEGESPNSQNTLRSDIIGYCVLCIISMWCMVVTSIISHNLFNRVIARDIVLRVVRNAHAALI